MGQRIVAAVCQDPELSLGAAIESPRHPRFGDDIGAICGLDPLGVKLSDELPRHIDVVVDFSIPDAAVQIAELCAQRGIPLVVCTTGFNREQRERVESCHHLTALMIVANASLVVNVLMKLVRDAARLLRDKDFDVEIVERHHRYKHDAPSGTALRFAEIIEEEMRLTGRVYGRQGLVGERPRTEIGLHAVRVGDNVGEHTVIFSTLGETMELVHRAHGRESYVKGAIAALKFLAGKKPGRYTMADVLAI
jgi:4-hydroxy-tetrahydrodipicolinate reductase